MKRLRGLGSFGACLLTLLSVPNASLSQTIETLRVKEEGVALGEVVRVQVRLRDSQGSVWCGLRVDFGNGVGQDIRVGERGLTDLDLQVEYVYPSPGKYLVSAKGKFLTRGLRSASACEGESSARVVVDDPSIEAMRRQQESRDREQAELRKKLDLREQELREKQAELERALERLKTQPLPPTIPNGSSSPPNAPSVSPPPHLPEAKPPRVQVETPTSPRLEREASQRIGAADLERMIIGASVFSNSGCSISFSGSQPGQVSSSEGLMQVWVLPVAAEECSIKALDGAYLGFLRYPKGMPEGPQVFRIPSHPKAIRFEGSRVLVEVKGSSGPSQVFFELSPVGFAIQQPEPPSKLKKPSSPSPIEGGRPNPSSAPKPL